MNIRFYNARIISMSDKYPQIFDGELYVSDNKITYVGNGCDACKPLFDKEIDCKGNVLMPGLKNSHTHTAMTFARSFSDNLPLDEWLHTRIFPMEGKLTDECVYSFSTLGFAEYLKNGITSCFDMYFNLPNYNRASIDCGFRSVLCGSVNDFGGIDRLEDEFIEYNRCHELISMVLGFHAEYTTSEDIMRRISDIAHKYNAPVYAHNSETIKEVNECIGRYKRTPTQVMDDLGLFDYGGGGFHCVWFNDDDIEIFKKRNLYAVTNPCSNLKLASGIADIQRYYKEGINVAIGTDGAGSNNALDMFREIYLASVLCKVKNDDASAIDPYDLLKSATAVGAKAMGLNNCDCLEEGKIADIIMLDMSLPNMRPINNVISNIVYSGNPSNVVMTMVNGKILYDHGEFTTIDTEKVYSDCDRLMETFN